MQNAGNLLPKRREIYYLIKDHIILNFDQIRRRFVSINERTLRYDLKKLCDAGLIKKLAPPKASTMKLAAKRGYFFPFPGPAAIYFHLQSNLTMFRLIE